MALKSNRPLDFWDKFGNAVDKLRSRGAPKGGETAFNSGIKKMQKARFNRDKDGAASMMQQLLDGNASNISKGGSGY